MTAYAWRWFDWIIHYRSAKWRVEKINDKWYVQEFHPEFEWVTWENSTNNTLIGAASWGRERYNKPRRNKCEN